MQPIFKGFENRDQIAREFSGLLFSWSKGEPMDLSYADIEIAVYDGDGYWGEVFILYRDNRDNEWYEVHASHCSCFGLEGQWEPEQVDPLAILMRPRFLGYGTDPD